ncbi:hypothetical protein, partial [Escherichia coli]|uniref:hypothetical protein n=1 Tax=Escherichia coli TaxID=562 RepID=UPI0020BDA805
NAMATTRLLSFLLAFMAILVQSQWISLAKGSIGKVAAGDFLVGLTVLGRFSLLIFLVFVIFTFCKEGIGNILNHAIYGGLGSWN